MSFDFDVDSFASGSWVFLADAGEHAAIRTSILLRTYGFSVLKRKYNRFDVSKGNKSVLSYHNLFSPELIEERDGL